MPNYPRPRSSLTRKSDRSSLHPHGAPTFAETLAGLKEGLMNLGAHLVETGAGIAGNLLGGLANLKKSADEGDEEAEQAYQDAIAMLRSSGSSTAESLLRELGEETAEGEGVAEASPEDSDSGGLEAEQGEGALKETASAPKPENTKGRITCRECGTAFKRLTHSHLAKHGMSLREYRKKYGLTGPAQASPGA